MKLSLCPCSHSSLAGQTVVHACLWHLKCNQARARLMQHLSSYKSCSQTTCAVDNRMWEQVSLAIQTSKEKRQWPQCCLHTMKGYKFTLHSPSSWCSSFYFIRIMTKFDCIIHCIITFGFSLDTVICCIFEGGAKTSNTPLAK